MATRHDRKAFPNNRLFLPLLVAIIVALEQLFRWSNGLELGWGWVAYRVGVLAAIFLVSGWSSRREARRSRTSGPARDNIWVPIFSILFGGAGSVVTIWRLAAAFLTGRVVVSTTPEAYTAWSANPSGFAIAVGLDALVVLVFVLVLFGGFALLWNYFRGRHGPAWP